MNNLVKNTKIFNWALTESQIPEFEVLRRFPKFEIWITGEIEPSVAQIKELSTFLKIPFGMFFLEDLPKSNFEVEFRTIQNNAAFISKNLKDTILDIGKKRDWLSDYRKQQGWEPVLDNIEINLNDPILFNEYLYKILELNDRWNFNAHSIQNAFDILKMKIEKMNILVMQNGVVGDSNSRKLDVEEFRAFALYDDYAPIIFINRNDSQNGRLFSLVHELIHILIGEDDIFSSNFRIENEQKINSFVAEFLIPTKEILNLMGKNNFSDSKVLNFYAKKLKVSDEAFAIKLYHMGIIDRAVLDVIKNETIAKLNLRKISDDGGNYYFTKVSRLGEPFIESVYIATDNGKLNFRDAYRLLGVKGKVFDNLKANLGI